MPDGETDYLYETTSPETMAHEVRSDLIVRPEKRHLVIRLRRLGMSYEQISEAIERDPDYDESYNVSPHVARTIVHQYLEKMASEDRESLDQLRELENMRLDDMQKALARKISDANVPAIKAALAIMERRAKLNGLDAPEIKGLIGAFAHTHDVADPDAVQEAERAFIAAFSKPGLPDVQGNGRKRS